jgi:hypothetical protein
MSDQRDQSMDSGRARALQAQLAFLTRVRQNQVAMLKQIEQQIVEIEQELLGTSSDASLPTAEFPTPPLDTPLRKLLWEERPGGGLGIVYFQAKARGIETLEELVACSVEEVGLWKRIGSVRVRELRHWLRRRGLDLRTE